jgi:hypothetical protein
MKTSPASRESDMPTDQRDNNRRDPMHCAFTLTPSPAPAKPDRATYESSRRAELDRIPTIDIERRQLLDFCPLGIHEIDHLRDDEDFSPQDKEEQKKVESKLYLSHRVLVQAIEGYLLGCVEYPVLTAEAALRLATDTDNPIDLLQAGEDLMIRDFASPWVEQTPTFSEPSFNHPYAPGGRSVPTQGVAVSGTAKPWRWPWR